MQFNTIRGKVDVRASDYGLAARFEPRHAYCCMALMLHKYHSELSTAIESQSRAFVAKPISKKVIDSLVEDVAPLTTIHNFLKARLQTYKWAKGGNAREKFFECVAAQTRLFADCGKILEALGGILATATAEKKLNPLHQSTALLPQDRSEALEARTRQDDRRRSG